MENRDMNDSIELFAKDIEEGAEAASRAISGGKRLAYLAAACRIFADLAKLMEATIREKDKALYKVAYEIAGMKEANLVRYNAPAGEAGEMEGE